VIKIETNYQVYLFRPTLRIFNSFVGAPRTHPIPEIRLYKVRGIGTFDPSYFWRIACFAIRRARFLAACTSFVEVRFAPLPAPLAGVTTVFDLSASAAPPTGGIGAVYTDIGIYVGIVGVILVNTGLAVVALTKILEFLAFQGPIAHPTGIGVR